MAGKVKKYMRNNSSINISKLTAPAFISGVDFSDHRNYWKRGFKAIMLTDTAFYRNRNYHSSTDSLETLDYKKMAEVVKGVFAAIQNL